MAYLKVTFVDYKLRKIAVHGVAEAFVRNGMVVVSRCNIATEFQTHDGAVDIIADPSWDSPSGAITIFVNEERVKKKAYFNTDPTKCSECCAFGICTESMHWNCDKPWRDKD